MVKEYGYEYDAILKENLWNDCANKAAYDTFQDALCLRSGRDALRVIAREYSPTNIYLPALTCRSMSYPFEQYGYKIIYYRLNQDYTIDFDFLLSKLNSGLFLYMNYFGIKSINEEQLDYIREKYPNLILIEDITHDYIWRNLPSLNADYTIASVRKWINVPDGGLLWTHRSLKNSYFLEDISFTSFRLQAQCMRHGFFETGDEKIKQKYRQIFSTVGDYLNKDIDPARMSLYSFELLSECNWDDIRKIRKSNSTKLLNILKKSEINIIQPTPGKSDLFVPFLVDNRTKKQEFLSSMGIFDTIIWPLTDDRKAVCYVSKFTEENMLAAPCDQRYTNEDMEFIGKEIVKVCTPNPCNPASNLSK